MYKGAGTLISKKKLSTSTWEYVYELSTEVAYIPGQFVNVSVTPPYRRPYSIVDISGKNITLMLELRDPGKGADFFNRAKIGETTEFMGPLGRFCLTDTHLKKVFVATGAGVAPFIPMIKYLLSNNNQLDSIDLYFGLRDIDNDTLVTEYLAEEIKKGNIAYCRCFTGEDSRSLDVTVGRVTHVVPNQKYDWKSTEFYVCGSNDMVKEMRSILTEKGVPREHIVIENYG